MDNHGMVETFGGVLTFGCGVEKLQKTVRVLNMGGTETT